MTLAIGGVGSVGSSTATCPPGMRAARGGWQGDGTNASVAFNAGAAEKWSVIMVNNSEFVTASFSAFAFCVS